ncbi:hypothetical protein PHSY_007258 [Pseudozyma hubeiensis SY62]|uniref:Uncharacterized protein n=1 Tax=Pseudozyma hubeiensis (strain SY62) TaxID=1305764 RepID=R9PND8_PSEHS|nr:hypothetical protein PHSY_007258 [Pseudozyma hubeiensis SY62]GAC99655.1 hypothetical protein PHSY_007258 [Pseudozyma hubeiensis SY62]
MRCGMCSVVWRISSGRSEQTMDAFNETGANVMVDDAIGGRIHMELDFRSRDKRVRSQHTIYRLPIQPSPRPFSLFALAVSTLPASGVSLTGCAVASELNRFTPLNCRQAKLRRQKRL